MVDAERVQACVKTWNVSGQFVVRFRAEPLNVLGGQDAVDFGPDFRAFGEQWADEDE